MLEMMRTQGVINGFSDCGAKNKPDWTNSGKRVVEVGKVLGMMRTQRVTGGEINSGKGLWIIWLYMKISGVRSMTLYEDKLSYEYGYMKINWVKTMTLHEDKLSHEYDSTWK